MSHHDSLKMERVFESHGIVYSAQPSGILVQASSLGKYLGISNIRDTSRTFGKHETCSLRVATRGGMQKLNYLREAGVRRVLCSSRKTKSVTLAKELGIDVTHKYVASETSFVIQIKKAFCGETIQEQHRVGVYLLDLYMPKYNVAIEFDERGHKSQMEADLNREESVKQAIGCSFLRISEYMDIFDAINCIYRHIIGVINDPEYYVSKKQTREETPTSTQRKLTEPRAPPVRNLKVFLGEHTGLLGEVVPEEEVTKEITEEVTEEVAEEVTDEITEEVTEEITEEVTEPRTIDNYLRHHAIHSPGSIMNIQTIKRKYREWSGQKIEVADLSMDTFTRVNPDWTVVPRARFCKDCSKRHRKGCCDKFSLGNKSTMTIVENISLVVENISPVG